MNETYYVVSGSELHRAIETARMAQAYPHERMEQAADDAEAACRARPVRFIGAADQGSSLMLWGEVKRPTPAEKVLDKNMEDYALEMKILKDTGD